MTKNDLKDGMIVELRNGDKRLVLNGGLADYYSYNSLELYTDDLKFTGSSHDIMKIYSSKLSCLNDILNIKNHDLIWERKDKSEYEINLEKIQNQIEKLNKSVEEFKNEITKLVCQNIERRINDYIRRDD